jgi:hypothetical protein
MGNEKLQVRHTSAIAIREQSLSRFLPLPFFCLLDPVLKGCHCSTSLQRTNSLAEILPPAQHFFNSTVAK